MKEVCLECRKIISKLKNIEINDGLCDICADPKLTVEKLMKRLDKEKVIDELVGVIIMFDDKQVEVKFDEGITVIFPSTLFRNQQDLLSKGHPLKYQILKDEKGELFERFIAHKEENALQKNKDIFDLWDSITTKK